MVGSLFNDVASITTTTITERISNNRMRMTVARGQRMPSRMRLNNKPPNRILVDLDVLLLSLSRSLPQWYLIDQELLIN